MINLTKYVLKRPVTTVLCILCLFVFGLSSVLSSKIELTPEMNIPMMIISTVYPGASPDDVTELVTKPIEDEVGTLSGIKNTTSYSQENISIILLEYDYGTDMNEAYLDLKKKIDNLRDMPDDVETSNIFEFNMNDMPTIMMAVNNPTVDNLYNYVENEIAPEFEKISAIASVDVSGGREGYVSIELIPEKLKQYHLTSQNVAEAVANSDFSYPAGNTDVGSLQLSVSTSVEYKTIDSLKKIPVVVGNGKTIYLEDVANISSALEKASAIGRYNGNDTIVLSIKKQQKNSAMEVTKAVTRTIKNLKADNPNLDIVVVHDNSDEIKSSLKSVADTLIMAVIISMVIIFLFFGDLKASLIVGSSIPVSILASLILMAFMGFSLNVITLSSLVLGVGMMVDNSIVVLESCFRSTKSNGFRAYLDAALEGTGLVAASILGGTLTTCVVFLPLALLEGMTGQLFKPLGFTIVFCMLASLISAMTVVPLCYSRFRPLEKERAPLSGFVRSLQDGYRKLMDRLLNHKKLVMLASVLLLIVSFVMVPFIGFELMPDTDAGTISITVETRPGLKLEHVNEVLTKVEDIVRAEPDLDSYIASFGGSGLSLGGGASVTAYLKDDRKLSTAEVVHKWKQETKNLDDCNLTIESQSGSGTQSGSSDDAEVILQSAQYDKLKQVSDQVAKELTKRPDVAKVHSDLENAAPVVKVKIDPVKAAAEGFSPIQIGGQINAMLSGKDVDTIDIDGNDYDITVEYADTEYDTIDKVKGIILPTAKGTSVALADIADIVYEDSPASISRKNKQYQVTITGSYTELSNKKTKAAIDKEVVTPLLNENTEVTRAKSATDESMVEEFSALFSAIATAIFLVFVVMAAQFESPKFSIMVMTTIPFSLIGSFGLLFLVNVKISMTSLLGFLMLIGTVVNAGILYVDTTNQYRAEMDKRTAMIEAGATRLRPIMMTTLTTIVAMIPMALAYGDSGEMMQGLALVNVGGLTASTILSLLMLPIYYALMSGGNRKEEPVLD